MVPINEQETLDRSRRSQWHAFRGRSLTGHLRAILLACVIVGATSTANLTVGPSTHVLASTTKAVSAAECAKVHKGMADFKDASPELRAWGQSKSTSDCQLEKVVTEKVSQSSTQAWDGCYNRQSYERFTSSLWPYPRIATGYMNYGLCWTQTEITISWTSCWVQTFIGYGGGQNYCGGAPTSAGSWCAAEDDWYFYPYSAPWWHLNHGFRDTWSAPLWMTGQDYW